MIRCHVLAVIALFVVSGVLMVSSSVADPNLPNIAGDWVGTLRIGGREDFVRLRFRSDGAQLTGSVDYPLSEAISIQMSAIRGNVAKVHLEWRAAGGNIVFDGGIVGRRLFGTIEQNASHGTLEEVRTEPVAPAALDPFNGLYELGPDRVISILHRGFGPLFTDFETGRTAVLFPESKDRFFAGPASLLPTPVQLHITFTRDREGGVTGLVWQEANRPARAARKLSFRREEVTFHNGAVLLSGTLVLPSGRGPYPAIVRIHGAGPADRINGTDEFHAYHGFAFLSYDKRGVGMSTGDWRQAGVDELAGDALAAVRYLRGRKDIHPNEIGLGAGSEGGWVAAAAASREKHVAFIVMIAGPAISFSDELLNETEVSLKRMGYSGMDIRSALRFEKYIGDMIRSGDALTDTGYQQIQNAADKVRGEKWFPDVPVLAKGDWRLRKFHRMSQFDPTPLWQAMTLPVLAIYGGMDTHVPAQKNAAALESDLKKAGNKLYKIVIFPKANHDGLEARQGESEGFAGFKRFVPGYFDVEINWLKASILRAR